MTACSCKGSKAGPVDAGPPVPVRCVGGWPDPPPAAAVAASLDVNAPVVLWRRQVPSTAYRMGLAVASDRVALVAGNSLFLLDAQTGAIVAQVRDDAALEARAPAVAAADGTFYFAGARLFAVNRDGTVLWQKSTYPGAWGDSVATSDIRLSPGGTLYFTATDGKLHAVRAADGQELWTREVGFLGGGGPQWLGPGVGDTLFVGGVPYDAATGEPGVIPVVDGEPLLVGAALANGILLAGSRPGTERDMTVALDRCFRQVWSPQMAGSWAFSLVGPAEGVLVRGIASDGTATVYFYSSAGDLLAGPAEVRTAPNVFGRDGTLYAVDCQGTTSQTMQLRAYGPDLAFKWDLYLAATCAWQGAVLDDRGVLFVARDAGLGELGAEVIAVQTRSPGTLDSSWPAWRHDSRGTGWLGQPN